MRKSRASSIILCGLQLGGEKEEVIAELRKQNDVEADLVQFRGTCVQ